MTAVLIEKANEALISIKFKYNQDFVAMIKKVNGRK